MLSAIVLAAGLSQRMGNINKLLLPYNKKTIVTTTIGNILAARIEEVIVVVGNESVQVKAAIQDLPVRIIYNSGYKKGMTTSIQQGVGLAKGDGYMICLPDMVLITPDEYELLKNAFEKQMRSNSKCICLPRYNNEKGNPVIFSSYYKEAIMQHTDMEGCKGIVQSNEENTYWIDMPANHVLQDMDYPEDYERVSKFEV